MSLDTQTKIDIAKQKKEVADQAFKTGQLKDALRAYHEALLYLNGIDKSAMQSVVPSADANADETKKKTEVDEILEKIYANQSACHIKNGNWKRALEAADKALTKNEDNHKAAFRKGKAQAEMGYVEKAEKTLSDLLKKNPSDAPAINAELTRIRAADAERQKQHDKKLRGFLSRGKDKETKLEESRIEEVDDSPADAALASV
ncbi:TPR-like protein [Ramaria rubella]|nr:TPR-like protein [Ramaria rubella]